MTFWKTLLVLALTLCSSCGSSDANADIPYVKPGYSRQNASKKLTDAQLQDRLSLLLSIEANYASDVEDTVATLWQHLNRRLVEKGAHLRVVVETQMEPLNFNEMYLQNKILLKEVNGLKLSQNERRTWLSKANCNELLDALVANTGLTRIDLSEAIILSDYISNE